MPTPSVTLSGNIQDLTGSANAGKIIVTLVNFGTTLPVITGTTSLASLSVIATANGSGAYSVALWGNNQISPSGTFYQITVQGADGSTILTAAYQFLTGGTFDLSNLQQMSPSAGQTITSPQYVQLTANGIQTMTAGLALPIITNGSQLQLQETGDTLGSINLYLRNRSGSNGGILENPNVCLSDLGFQTSAKITNIAIDGSNNLTVTAAFATGAGALPSVGQKVTLSGLKTATFLNGQVVTIATISSTQFTATFSHALYASAPDTGTAVAQLNVRAEFRPSNLVSTANTGGEIQLFDPASSTAFLAAGLNITSLLSAVVGIGSSSRLNILNGTASVAGAGGTINNLAIPNTTVVLLIGTATNPITLTGMTAGNNGDLVILINDNTNGVAVTLSTEDANSSPNNRFRSNQGGNPVMNGNIGAVFCYYFGNRWGIIGKQV